ncbi:DUF5672 family protein [Mucilaginibacter sp. AW1-7]|uniref:DUF5672 family protein n=1 Tax=Mucilaginibacter sp. AW1-7 TaxID=3349874 RepID=UPI003F732896
MDNNQAVIIIPVYKPEPNENEIRSLRQCCCVLKAHPIIFVAPESLNTAAYNRICSSYRLPFTQVRFEDRFFAGITGYNQLMLSPFFYKAFLGYRFLLIYQLDAFVFKDELSYWCRQNYDFIGAPHLPHENAPEEIRFLQGYSRILGRLNGIFQTNHRISNVGNGGFSLRKTRTCYWLLRLLPGKVKHWGSNNEDGFFKYWGNLLYPLFRLPPDEVALRFSVEQSPQESLKKLGFVLPFGCHAFEKHEPETWRPYITAEP